MRKTTYRIVLDIHGIEDEPDLNVYTFASYLARHAEGELPRMTVDVHSANLIGNDDGWMPDV